jgi:hypothetical protein
MTHPVHMLFATHCAKVTRRDACGSKLIASALTDTG